MLQNQSPQIHQSPARLGLTNPNSPSISNPKLTSQNHFQQQQQQQTPSATTLPATTITTSSSLLPPLCRAQSLLLQMASLASKLFKLPPNPASSCFTSFRASLPTFLPSQTLTLTLNPPPLDSSPNEIISLFTTLQTQLFESVAQLQEILHLQDAKQKIAREITTKDAAILAFADKLKEAEHVLDLLVGDYSEYHRPKRSESEGNSDDTEMTSTTSIATSLKLNDILSYSHKISYTTFAPPEFGVGRAPLRGALPPAPQEEQMRASQLYSFADLDIGLPKIESSEKAIETLVDASGLPTENDKLGDLAASQGLPHLTVPSGWRPGMPVELPIDFLPSMPPAGWKFGDPVPLPPLEAHVLRKAEEEQPRRCAPILINGPEPFQVRRVLLDIDQDQSDSSSEYSSDGSSGED